MREEQQVEFGSERLRKLSEGLKHHNQGVAKVFRDVLAAQSTQAQAKIRQEEYIDGLSFDMRVLEGIASSLSVDDCSKSYNSFHVFNEFSRQTLGTYEECLGSYQELAEGDYQASVGEAYSSTRGLRGTINDLAGAVLTSDASTIGDALKQQSQQYKNWDKTRKNLAQPEAIKKVAENLVKATNDALQQSSANPNIQKWQSEINRLLVSPPSAERDALLKQYSNAVQAQKKLDEDALKNKEKQEEEKRKREKQKKKEAWFNAGADCISIAESIIDAVAPHVDAKYKEDIKTARTYVAYAQGALKIGVGIAAACGAIALSGG